MLSLFTLMLACKGAEPVYPQIDFLFKETQCANPWGSIVTPEWTREQIVSYYLTDVLEVEFSDLSIASDGEAELCAACVCLTGDNIRISADEEFSEILLENGFEIEE